MATTTTTRRGFLGGGRGDAAALRPLLAAQQLSLACYERVIGAATVRDAGPTTRQVLAQIRVQEREHVAATRAALHARGGAAPAAPASLQAVTAALMTHQVAQRPDQLRGLDDALALLVAVERIAVGAAHTALGLVRSPRLAVLVAQLMGSDAQHEALVSERMHPGDVADAIAYGIVIGSG